MEALERLIEKAEPGPPWIRPWQDWTIHGFGQNHVLGIQANLDLAVAAVNALPAHISQIRALQAALQAIVDLADGGSVWHAGVVEGMQELIEEARFVLAWI